MEEGESVCESPASFGAGDFAYCIDCQQFDNSILFFTDITTQGIINVYQVKFGVFADK